MRYTGKFIIFGSALLAGITVAPFAVEASVIESPRTQVVRPPITIEPPSPYQKGYEKGGADGYSAALTQTREHCAGSNKPWPAVEEGNAYSQGYFYGYRDGYYRGFAEGMQKFCTPR
ncbi:hypothetical protein HII36_32025 [Nonomuraea sp. NN258]|uniref:hypothetical protein n=1 Tax=Nonomuraea antri TaxID=2730852 RepID=UPI00156925BB|nr:hypothetical protein [Nonomuraea antri]NRQ36427.1 hypothetical protein [Nonomuraea antri]